MTPLRGRMRKSPSDTQESQRETAPEPGNPRLLRVREAARAVVRGLCRFFGSLWDYNSATWAGKFLDEWCRQVMRSRIERNSHGISQIPICEKRSPPSLPCPRRLYIQDV